VQLRFTGPSAAIGCLVALLLVAVLLSVAAVLVPVAIAAAIVVALVRAFAPPSRGAPRPRDLDVIEGEIVRDEPRRADAAGLLMDDRKP
jgi:hypothetical protein